MRALIILFLCVHADLRVCVCVSFPHYDLIVSLHTIMDAFVYLCMCWLDVCSHLVFPSQHAFSFIGNDQRP